MTGSRGLLALSFVLALATPVGRPAHAQEAADKAWSEGDLAAAERLYAARLEADPSDERALHRLALMRAWEGRMEASLTLFDRLLALFPENTDAARDRARVLAWSGDLEGSRLAYEAILAARPHDLEARVGLGQVQLWAGRYGEAERLFRQVLDGNPRDPAALEGYAQAAAWADRLGPAEDRWRSALRAIPEHPVLVVGLARTLRWQGRPAAALEILEESRRRHPDDQGVAREWAEVRVLFEPLVGAEVAFELDSDGNRMLESSAHGEWHPRTRLVTRLDLVSRRAEDPAVVESSTAVSVGIAAAIEPGWEIRGAGGVAGDGGGGASPILRAGFSTPGRHAARFTLTGSYAPLVATARSIERDVTSAEIGADLVVGMGGGWRLSGGGSVGRLEARRSNRRTTARVGLARRLSRGWSIQGAARILSFEADLDDGYFDPSRLVMAETGPGWSREGERWSVETAAAVGLQRVEEKEAAPTFRAEGAATYELGPGEIVVQGAFATAALTAFTTGEADYRYGRLAVGSRWRF